MCVCTNFWRARGLCVFFYLFSRLNLLDTFGFWYVFERFPAVLLLLLLLLPSMPPFRRVLVGGGLFQDTNCRSSACSPCRTTTWRWGRTCWRRGSSPRTPSGWRNSSSCSKSSKKRRSKPWARLGSSSWRKSICRESYRLGTGFRRQVEVADKASDIETFFVSLDINTKGPPFGILWRPATLAIPIEGHFTENKEVFFSFFFDGISIPHSGLTRQYRAYIPVGPRPGPVCHRHLPYLHGYLCGWRGRRGDVQLWIK